MTLPAFSRDEELVFRLLRQLDARPGASQRATAEALGVDLDVVEGQWHAYARAVAAR